MRHGAELKRLPASLEVAEVGLLEKRYRRARGLVFLTFTEA